MDKDGDAYKAHIKQFYTASTDERAKLHPVIVSSLGRDLTKEEEEDFDLETLIGKNVQVTIDHKKKNSGDDTDYVKTVSALMDGTPIVELESTPITFGFDQNPDGSIPIPEAITPGIKRWITDSEEWKRLSPSLSAPGAPKPTVTDSVKAAVEEATSEEEQPEAGQDEKLIALLASLPDDIDPKVREELIERMKKVG